MRLHPKDEDRLSAVTFAVMLDRGYLSCWPHEWSARASKLIRAGRAGVMFSYVELDSVPHAEANQG